MSSIDIVIPWVDGSDIKWQTEKAKYTGITGDGRDIRYRDWGLLKYVFRGIEKNAPWIRKVHFVTCNQKPEWLNTECSRLNLVNHTDYIPNEYLPTFSSHPIELNMHRIEGLSETFLYTNDDIFFIAPTTELYWFKNGIPCDEAIISPYLSHFRNSIGGIVSNNLEIINTRFNKAEVIRQHKSNWINIKYGKYNLYNIVSYLWPYFTGFRGSHYVNAFRKETFMEVWETEFEILDATCRRKIRDRMDVNQWLMRYWQLASNSFIPRKQKGSTYILTSDPIDKIRRVLTSGDYSLVCLNDSGYSDDFETRKHELLDIFECILPQKSSFEI